MSVPSIKTYNNIWHPRGFGTDAWTYGLVSLALPEDVDAPADYLRQQGRDKQLSIQALCTALQHGCDLTTIKWYIQNYRQTNSNLEKDMKQHGASAFYCAVERNSVAAVQLLMDFGADPRDYRYNRHPEWRVPVIAFAVLHGKKKSLNTTGLVRYLLSQGVNPHPIPSDMWENFLATPKATGPRTLNGLAEWCHGEIRKDVVEALHLTHRYSLHRASKLSARKAREIQIATITKMCNPFSIPYFLVGQLPSAKLVMDRVFMHIGHQTSTRPLVMAVAGPSGHGKTELAIQLGDLLSVKHKVLDCTPCVPIYTVLEIYVRKRIDEWQHSFDMQPIQSTGLFREAKFGNEHQTGYARPPVSVRTLQFVNYVKTAC